MFKYILCDDISEIISKLLGVAIQLYGNEIAFWFYPECTQQNTYNGEMSLLNGFSVPIEKVTLYDDEKYCENIRYLLSNDTLEDIAGQTINQIDLLDSISIYKDGAAEWFLALVFHENVCILKGLNTAEENVLAEHGFIVSDSPPEGW